MKKNSIDFLVVGNGLAGSLIAFELFNLGYTVKWLVQDLPGAASKVATGIVNPITGMRYVKSWNFDLLIEEALHYYRRLESFFGAEFLNTRQIYQQLSNPEEENQWLSRTADPVYSNFIKLIDPSDAVNTFFKKPFGMGKINPAYQLNIVELLTKIEHFLTGNDVVIHEVLNFDELKIDKTNCEWKDYSIHHAAIFCEGFRVNENPFFNYLPVFKLKGDYQKVEILDFSWSEIYKADYTLVPILDSQYWIGSNYELKNTSLQIDHQESEKQLSFLKSIIKNPFKLIQQGFGIRPSTRDRRPIIGQHPEFSKLKIINGFGTKGVSLAPYCINAFINYILHNITIPKEISISRFDHLYKNHITL